MMTGNLDTSISLVVNGFGQIYYSINGGIGQNIIPCVPSAGYANNILFTDKSTVICGYFPNAFNNSFLHTIYNSSFNANAQIEFDLFYLAGNCYNVIPYPTSIPTTDAYIYITNGTNQPDDINKIYMGFSTAYPHILFNIVPDTNVQIGFFSSMPVNFQIANPVITYLSNENNYTNYQNSIFNISNNIFNNSLDLKNGFNSYNNISNILINAQEGNTDLTELNSSLNTLYNNVNNASNTISNIAAQLFEVNNGLVTQFITLGKTAYNLQNEIDLLQESGNTIINNINEIENINSDIISFNDLFTSFMTITNADINNINNSITNLGDIGNISGNINNANYPSLSDVNNVVNNVTSSISSTQSSMISLVTKLKNKN